MGDAPDWSTLTGHALLLTNIADKDGAITADVHVIGDDLPEGAAQTYMAATLPDGIAAQAHGNAGTNRNNLGVFDGTRLGATPPGVAALARKHLASITTTTPTETQGKTNT